MDALADDALVAELQDALARYNAAKVRSRVLGTRWGFPDWLGVTGDEEQIAQLPLHILGQFVAYREGKVALNAEQKAELTAALPRVVIALRLLAVRMHKRCDSHPVVLNRIEGTRLRRLREPRLGRHLPERRRRHQRQPRSRRNARAGPGGKPRRDPDEPPDVVLAGGRA